MITAYAITDTDGGRHDHRCGTAESVEDALEQIREMEHA